MKILIVEDERLLADSLKLLLESRGYEADAVYDGTDGMAYAESGLYELIILDVMLPGMNGYALARALRRKRSGVRILMLTAKSELGDRVEGLEAGADYYLTKPFDNRELLACIHSLLRRSGDETDRLTFGNTSLDLEDNTLRCGGEGIRLSAREFEMMRQLLLSGRRTISKETLIVKVWGYEAEIGENTVEVYIGFLRKKLLKIHSNVVIQVVRRLGYHLEVKEE